MNVGQIKQQFNSAITLTVYNTVFSARDKNLRKDTQYG